MPRVYHFDVACDQPERAMEFYKKVFDWKFEKWENPMEDYWFIDTGKGKGINGGLGKRQSPDQNVTSTIQVGSIENYSKKIEEAGGKITMPKMAIPGVGWLAYFEDTEGNKFAMMQEDKNAK